MEIVNRAESAKWITFPNKFVENNYYKNLNSYSASHSRLRLHAGGRYIDKTLNAYCIVYHIKLISKKKLVGGAEGYAIFNTVIANIYYNVTTKKIEYVVFGPSYHSSDGEYRDQLVNFNDFLKAYDNNNLGKDVLEPIFKIVSNYINDGYYQANLEYTKYNKHLEQLINKYMLVPKLICIALCNVNHRLHIGRIVNNLSEGYNEALKNKDIIEYLSIKDEVRDIKLIYFLSEIAQNNFLDARLIKSFLGVKSIPMTLHAIETYQDLTNSLWKEFFISKLVTNLTINLITPCIPITLTRFINEGGYEGAYNNINQKLKYQYSDIVKEAIDKLRECKTYTSLIDPKKNEVVNLSFKTATLNKYVTYSIQYAKEELIYTNKNMCIVNEYCGATFADLGNIINQNALSKVIGPILLQEDLFNKYMFEIFYTLYCLNYNYDIIHTDLHLNNLCISRFEHIAKNPIVEPRSVVFNVHDKLFKFNQFGAYMVIIDFSRATVGNKVLSSFPETVKKEIEVSQKNRIKQALRENFPDLINMYENEINLLFNSKFETLYNVFKAIDSYKVSAGIISLLQSLLEDELIMPTRIDKVLISNKLIPTMQNIKTIGFNYVSNYLISLIKKIEIDIENPNLFIINSCFSKYLITNEYNPDDENLNVIAYYKVDNKIIYKSDYSNLEKDKEFTDPYKIYTKDDKDLIIEPEELIKVNKLTDEIVQAEIDNENQNTLDVYKKHKKQAAKLAELIEKNKKYYFDT